jgi:hypothetical protein
MSLHSWLQNLRSALAPRRGQRQHVRGGSKRTPTNRPNVEVLEDRSVPAFLAPVDYNTGDYPNDVKAGDFNNDGTPDLATANRNSDGVSVLLGNPDGTFQPARTTATAPHPGSLAVGDFNRDGMLDLAATTRDQLGGCFIDVLLGHGDGTFAPLGDYPLGDYTFQFAGSIATGDLNADGTLDLVATSRDYYGTTYARVLLGHGDGGFVDVGTSGPYYFSFSPTLALGDFDGDGKLDMALGGEDSTWVQLGNGDGTFQEARDLGVQGRFLAVADFDADGKLDLAATGVGITVFRGKGDGTFQPPQSFAAGAGLQSVNAADVNGDGVLDLVVTDGADVGGLSALLGNGDGSFGLPITTAVGPRLTALAVADFNADGRPDAAVTRIFPSKLSVLLNDGTWSPDDPPSVSIGDATVTEGNTGTINASFTLTLSKASNADVAVHYATADITATAGSDYTAASGDVIIPAGQTSATVSVAVRGDRLGEPDETFAVNLSAAANATIGDGQGIGAILDNEPRISISDVSKKEGKKGQKTQFTFTVTLSVPYDQPVTMSYRTVNGTATTGDNDYVAKSGTLTFAPGETTKTITIVVNGDSKREADEYFYLDLFGNSGNSWLTRKRGLGTILNDD